MDSAANAVLEGIFGSVESREAAPFRPCYSIAALPETLPIYAERYHALAIMGSGCALVSTMSVTAAGEIETGLYVDGEQSLSETSAMLAMIWPSIPSAQASMPVLSEQLTPLSPAISSTRLGISGVGPRPVQMGDQNFPSAPREWPWQIGKALQALALNGGGKLQIAFRLLSRDGTFLRELADDRSAALAEQYRSSDSKVAAQRLALLDAQRDDAAAFVIEVGYSGAECMSLRNLLSLALFGNVCAEVIDPSSSRCGLSQLPVRMMPMAGEARMIRATQALTTSPETGIEIGRVSSQAPLMLADRDRARHTYILGATGTGKSTLMQRLINQDIANGEGIILIDPHGDLSREVAASVPASRRSELIIGLVTVWFRSLVFHYATLASKAKGLMPPRYEWRLRAL